MLFESPSRSPASGRATTAAAAYGPDANAPLPRADTSADILHGPRLARRLDAVSPPPLPDAASPAREMLPDRQQRGQRLRAPSGMVAWRPGETADDEPGESRSAVAVTAGWLLKAEQNRRRQRLRILAGWVTAAVVCGGIVAGAAYTFNGWAPDFHAALQFGKYTLF